MDPSNYIEVNSAHKSNFYYKLTPKSVYTDITSLALSRNANGILSGEVDFRNKTIKPIKITYKNTTYGFSGTLTAYLSSPVCVRVSIPDTTHLVQGEPYAQLSTNFKMNSIEYPPNGSIKYVECEKTSDRTANISQYGDLSVKIANPLFIDGLNVTSQNLMLKKADVYVSFNSDNITAFNKDLTWNKSASTISTNLFISELCCKVDDYGCPISSATGQFDKTAIANLIVTTANGTVSRETDTINISCSIDTTRQYSSLRFTRAKGTAVLLHSNQVSSQQGVQVNDGQKCLLGDGYYHWQWNVPLATAAADLSIGQIQFKKCDACDNLSVHSITLSGNYKATKTSPCTRKLTLYSISDRTSENVISCQQS